MKYGNIIKDSSEISKLIASVKEKAESINDDAIKNTDAKDFFAKSAPRDRN